MQTEIDCVSVSDCIKLDDKIGKSWQRLTLFIYGNGCPKNTDPVALWYHAVISFQWLLARCRNNAT